MLITAFAYAKVGGWEQMLSSLQATNETSRLSMLRSPAIEKEFPWFAIFLGYPVLGIWYWCADQTIVQRVLGAKDENHARIGPLFCAVIKILPVFIFVLPGLLFYVIVRNGTISGLAVGNSKEVYGLMLKSLLPTGLFGVMAAALMAALMGNLASASQLDFHAVQLRPVETISAARRPKKQLVVIGRAGDLPVVRGGDRFGAAVGPLSEHLRGDQRRDCPHRPADHLRVCVGGVLGRRIGPQRQADDVDRLGAGGIAVCPEDAARLAAGQLCLDPAFLLRNALHDDGLLPVCGLCR